jgi:hypothetical protein
MTTTRHLAIAGGFLHIADRATPDSSPLDYDWDDFAGEFANVAGRCTSCGAHRYKIDDGLANFLRHFIGVDISVEQRRLEEDAVNPSRGETGTSLMIDCGTM